MNMSSFVLVFLMIFCGCLTCFFCSCKNKNSTPKEGILFVLSGPTGSGKTFAATYALKQLTKEINIQRVVTFTTRSPRPGEVNGVDYHFINDEEFQQKQEDGFFFETAGYAGKWYGSPKSMVDTLKDGKSWLLITDRSGALNIKKLHPAAILIWVDVPSIEILEQGLIHRGGQKALERLPIAKQEIEEEKKHPLFDFHILNDYKTPQVGQQLVDFIKQKLSR